jgi:WD40 repeat protein
MLTPQPSGLRAELSDGKMAVVVELAKGDLKQYTQLKPPAGPKGKAAVPPELSGGKKSTVETFKLPGNIPPAKPFAVLDAKQQVVSLAVSPDGKRVAVGSQQTLTGGFTADLAVWDIEQQKQVWIKKRMAVGDLASVQQLAFSGDGKILIACPAKVGEGEILRFYDAETGLELKSPPPLKMSIGCVAWHPTKLLLSVGTVKAFYGQLELIDPRTGKSLWAVSQVHRTQIDGLAFSPDGETIATFGRATKGKDYCVKLFDSAKGALIHEFPGTPNGIATSVAFAGDGKLVAALFGDLNKPALVIWDTATKQEVRRITDMATGGHSSRHNLAFLADNKTLAVSCWDRHLHMFDATTGQRTGVYPRAYGATVSDVYAVGDGQMLLTNRETEGLLLWKQSDALTPPTRELPK